MGETERTDTSREALLAQLEGMRSVKHSDAPYYCLTLTGSGDGTVHWAAQGLFVGWTDTTPRRELRRPRKINPITMLRLLSAIGQPCLVVNELPDLLLYLQLGGHGIIRADLAEQHLSDVLQPVEVARSTTQSGYVAVNSLPTSKLSKAPSKKLRMQVLKRDEHRCRVCGRSPANDVHVELHVHHVRPWGRGAGGMTEEANLITLCNTCHGGLDPHFDVELYPLIGVDPFGADIGEEQKALIEGIEAYRAIVRSLYGQENNQSQ